jgi:hypothetical protein
MCGDGSASPTELPYNFGERLCLEPSKRRGRASKNTITLVGKAKPFRTSGGKAEINQVVVFYSRLESFQRNLLIRKLITAVSIKIKC